MFLQQIKLSNFRAFRKLEMNFLKADGKVRDRTLLLGENGVGKSNLLKAIALVTAGTEALTEFLHEPEEYIRYGQKECRISATFVTAKGETRDVYLEIRQGDERSDVMVRSKKSLEALNDAISHSARNYFVVGYGSSRRLSRSARSREIYDFGSPRARGIATLFDPSATLNPLESWAMDLDYRNEKEGLATVRRVLSQFLRGVRFHSIDKRKGRLLFKTEDGIVPLSSLSEGFQNVATWVGDLLYQVTHSFENYKDPLKARGLLLIDEVGLHLHPSWQRELLSFLRDRLPNFQLVATTHSPLLAQQAGEGELFYLERRGRSVQIEQFEGSPSSLLVNQILMTDAFGLETDESFKVEQAREEAVRLRDKEKLSEEEETKLKKLREFLSGQAHPSRASSLSREADVLRLVQKQLLERRP